MNRRQFLISAAAAFRARGAADQTFLAGIVPAGRGRSAGDPAQTYWSSCDEVSALGFHHVEINNTRARIAELYSDRVSEFEDEMGKRRLTMAGLALFSHIAEAGERQDLIDRHMLLGRFLAAVGGKYITHMIAAGTVLNEPEDEEVYRQVDVKTWAANANEIGKRLFNECGVKLAYHPEQGEVRSGLHDRILAATDERYFRFLVDTGHVASGGLDAAAVCRKYRSRLECVHLKDFKPGDGKPAKAGNVPFGEGAVNLAAVVQVLHDTNFTGYVISESGGTNQTMRDYMVGVLGLGI